MKKILDLLTTNNYKVVNPEKLEGMTTKNEIQKWDGEQPLEVRVVKNDFVLLESIEQGGEFVVASHWSGSPKATCACPKFSMWINNPYWGKKNGRLNYH